MATTIGSLSNPVGCILGLVLGPFFIFDSDKDTLDPQFQVGKDHTNYYMVITAIIATVLSAPLFFLAREKPDKFPSKAAKSMINTEFDFKGDLKKLMRNKNYFWITICFMMMYGVYTTLGAIINNLVEPKGYTASDSSIFGASFILSGLVGSFVFSALLDKYQRYLLQLRVICFGVLFLYFFTFKTLQDKDEANQGQTNVILLSVNIACIGFILLPIIPLGYSFSIELTYPVSEAMSNGVLMLWS